MPKTKITQTKERTREELIADWVAAQHQQQRKQRVSKPAPPEEPQGADELDELFHVDPESALFKGFMARGLAKFGDEWDEKRRAAVSKTTKGRTTSSLECTPAEIAKMNRFLGPVSDEEE